MKMINHLELRHFRNFTRIALDFDSSLVLIIGDNGTGKTSILESLSLIGRSENLLENTLAELVCFNHNTLENSQNGNPERYIENQGFSIYTKLNHQYYQDLILNFYQKEGKKIFIVNGQAVAKNKIAEYRKYFINFIFLTPQIEQLFITNKSERRSYLDKIVGDIDLEHHHRISQYQKLLKERMAILLNQQQNPEAKNLIWLKIIEEKIAEIAVAIAFARVEAVIFFNKAIGEFDSEFPKLTLKITGETEEKIDQLNLVNAVELELEYREKLEKSRGHDMFSKKSNFGVHKSDFMAILLKNKILASQCSTGEQKSIMMAITIARARISSLYKQQPTVLLLDEVFSHLDNDKIRAIFNEIINCNLQCFLTATNSKFIESANLEHKLIQIINLSQ